MRCLLHNEDKVSRRGQWVRLVTLALEDDAGTSRPTRGDTDRDQLVLRLCRTVRQQPQSRDPLLLLTPRIELLQSTHQVLCEGVLLNLENVPGSHSDVEVALRQRIERGIRSEELVETLVR